MIVIVAFFSCGTAVQGAGARVAFALARDGALPCSDWCKQISPRHRTPANAILVGTIVPFLFLLLVLVNPSKPVHMLWFDYPANVNALYALVSFATSGIYLAFLLTVVGRARCAAPRLEAERSVHAGRWGVPVTIAGTLYLVLMLLNIVWPARFGSGRAVFNYGWVTLLVMALIVAVGALYEAIARPDRR